MTSDGSLVPAGGRRSILHSGYWLVLLLIVVSYAFCAAQVTPNPSAVALLVQLGTVAATLWVAEVRPGLRRAGWIVVAAAGVVVMVVAVIGTTGHLLDVLLSARARGARSALQDLSRSTPLFRAG